MKPKGVLNESPCPVARSVDIIGDRWSLLIIRDVFDGICRFSDFQKSLGIARNVLSDRLRKLVDENILEKKDASDGTSYQEYSLTSVRESLFPVVVALRQWGENNLFEKNEQHSLLVDKQTGKPVKYMNPISQEGQLLTAQDTEVKKIDE